MSPGPHPAGVLRPTPKGSPGPHLGGLQAHTQRVLHVHTYRGSPGLHLVGCITACTEADTPQQTATAAGGTHYTEMHSCFLLRSSSTRYDRSKSVHTRSEEGTRCLLKSLVFNYLPHKKNNFKEIIFYIGRIHTTGHSEN